MDWVCTDTTRWVAGIRGNCRDAARVVRRANTAKPPLWGVALVAVLAACDEPLPESPNVTEVIQAYLQGPTVDINNGEVGTTVANWSDRITFGEAMAEAGLLIDVVITNLELEETQSKPTQSASKTNDQDTNTPQQNTSASQNGGSQPFGGGLFLDMSVQATHICSGHNPTATAPAPDQNGSIDLQLNLTELGFEGVFWGLFDTCKLLLPEVAAGLGKSTTVLDGAVVQEMLNPEGFDLDRNYVFVLNGFANLNNVQLFNDQFDYAYTKETGVEIRATFGTDSQVVFVIPNDEHGVVELHTLTTIWRCDLSQRQCQKDDLTVITW